MKLFTFQLPEIANNNPKKFNINRQVSSSNLTLSVIDLTLSVINIHKKDTLSVFVHFN